MSDEKDEDIDPPEDLEPTSPETEQLPPKLAKVVKPKAAAKAKPGRKPKAAKIDPPEELDEEADQAEELAKLEAQRDADAAEEKNAPPLDPTVGYVAPKRQELQHALGTNCVCGARLARLAGSSDDTPVQCERKFHGTETNACQSNIPASRVVFKARPMSDIYNQDF